MVTFRANYRDIEVIFGLHSGALEWDIEAIVGLHLGALEWDMLVIVGLQLGSPRVGH